MADERVMENNFHLSPNTPRDVQFQLSLLRLMYPGPAASPQVAALEELQEPTGVLAPR